MAKKMNITQMSVKDFVESEMKRIDEDISSSAAFEYVSAQQVLTPYDIDDDETLRGLVGGGNDGGYDGIFIFVNELLYNGEDPDSLDLQRKSSVDIHFIQSKYQTGFEESIIQKWKDSFSNLINDEEPDRQRYCEKVIEAFSLIKAILKKTISNRLQVTLTFWAVSLGEAVHPNLRKQAEELEALVQSLVPAKNTEVRVEFVTATRLYELIDQSPDSVAHLRGTKEPLCPDDSSAIIAVKLNDFNDFATDADGNLNKSLFEANIRDYQGNVEVNKAIKRTLENKGSVDFWWLNNGITIVADSVARDMGDGISLTNPRIVNGLQTSNEIWRYCKTALSTDDERRVLVKCIAVADPEARAQIIQATNNQSSIPPAYLRSLDRVHLQIERYFKSHGLHYDRRKSSCKNEGIPAKDIIAVPFLGQCLIATLLQQPNYARARPAQIFRDETKYKRIFGGDISLKAYCALGKVSVFVRQSLKKSGFGLGVQNDLIFYVLLVLCAQQAGKYDLSPEDLEGLALPTSDDVQSVFCVINDEYQRLGGYASIVKNSSFVDTVKGLFRLEPLESEQEM